MTKLIRKNQKGFTLIELMIVVAIIGILAAIAIPNFLSYQLKSKTAEAKTNLGGIKTALESYRAEQDIYPDCAANPTAGVPAATKGSWTATASGWSDIGFAPAGSVYYQYSVNGTTSTFAATAIGNLDGKDGNATFTLTNAAALTGPSPANSF